jgi:hypothetical protein
MRNSKIEQTALAIVALSREGHTSVECMNLLPAATYEMSAGDLSAAFRRAGELLSKEADEISRYIALREICTELRPAGSATSDRIIGAANVAALCIAGEATRAEMMTNVAARVPGLSEKETAISVAAAAQFVETKAAV